MTTEKNQLITVIEKLTHTRKGCINENVLFVKSIMCDRFSINLFFFVVLSTLLTFALSHFSMFPHILVSFQSNQLSLGYNLQKLPKFFFWVVNTMRM